MWSLSFVEFVRSRRAGQNPRGDFIRDAREDSGLDNREFHDLESLLRYLDSCNACPGAIDAAENMWNEYISWEKRMP